MKTRPILFSAPMVRALLAGTKTQTRRIIKPQPVKEPNGLEFRRSNGAFLAWLGDRADVTPYGTAAVFCPYGAHSDRLWVRETLRQRDGAWFYGADDAGIRPLNTSAAEVAAWCHHKEGDVCVSIHMPRWAARLTLEITDVRVERLQAISEADARAEGVERHDDDGVTYFGPLNNGHASAVPAYRALWESINGAGSWDANPWVWALTFERVTA